MARVVRWRGDRGTAHNGWIGQGSDCKVLRVQVKLSGVVKHGVELALQIPAFAQPSLPPSSALPPPHHPPALHRHHPHLYFTPYYIHTFVCPQAACPPSPLSRSSSASIAPSPTPQLMASSTPRYDPHTPTNTDQRQNECSDPQYCALPPLSSLLSLFRASFGSPLWLDPPQWRPVRRAPVSPGCTP